ncbi:NADP-dependent alcohol dehydrogenase [Fusarium agapanthi]|uniref:NADP-dependent alcohol dehydrogenase n=1 Tax=Fusarium agapanthi TaxID=1803897 RepID=A0A9P5B0B2_9HYPO|nr:NADP-dependent alcohol dehydrogenase [Fusarium agapanthi]
MATLTPMPSQVAFRIHPVYRIFFLILEPISALTGAFYTHFRQDTYLSLLHASSAPAETPKATSVAMSQLANMFFFFALNEALVLRSTADLRVWRTVLLVLLIADMGHLFSMSELGPSIYWDVMAWNASDWGNVPFVYLGMTMRVSFLLGIGLGESRALKKKNWKKQ